MKKVIFTLISFLALGNAASAQWMADSVVMGTTSTNDVFYSLKNGIVKTENNKNWHLAFSLLSGADSAAVWANHNSGASYVKVYNVHKDGSQWATVVLGDTSTATLCFNNDQRWTQGAFNANASSSTQYGWGHYAGTPSHDIVGDSIYIVKANGIFYKFFINSLTGVGPNAGDWNLQISDFTTTTYDTVKSTSYPNRHFIYYDLATGADTNREPAISTWDFVFNRYTTNDPLSGPNPFNSVIGALSNKGVKVSKANLIHVDTAFAHYGDYVMPWPVDSFRISGIGYSWKVFTPPTTWSVPDSVSYFVEDVDGNSYQLKFISYSGSGTGIIHFKKRLVQATAITDIHSAINRYELYPNPAQNIMNIMLDSKENTEVALTLSTLSGQTVFTSSLKINNGLNSYSVPTTYLSNGNYILSLNGKNISVKEKITVSK